MKRWTKCHRPVCFLFSCFFPLRRHSFVHAAPWFFGWEALAERKLALIEYLLPGGFSHMNNGDQSICFGWQWTLLLRLSWSEFKPRTQGGTQEQEWMLERELNGERNSFWLQWKEMRTEEPLFPERQTTWLSPQQGLVLSQELFTKKDCRTNSAVQSSCLVCFAVVISAVPRILFPAVRIKECAYTLTGASGGRLLSRHHNFWLYASSRVLSKKEGRSPERTRCWRIEGGLRKKTLLLSGAYGWACQRQLLTLCGLIVH